MRNPVFSISASAAERVQAQQHDADAGQFAELILVRAAFSEDVDLQQMITVGAVGAIA
jgi:hypothetical protein